MVETSLLTGAIPNQVRNCKTSRFVSVPGRYPGSKIILVLHKTFLPLTVVPIDTSQRSRPRVHPPPSPLWPRSVGFYNSLSGFDQFPLDTEAYKGRRRPLRSPEDDARMFPGEGRSRTQRRWTPHHRRHLATNVQRSLTANKNDNYDTLRPAIHVNVISSITILQVGRGGAFVELKPFNRRVVGSTPSLAAT